MAEILAFIGSLLLAVQVWRWFASLAFLLFAPFGSMASLITGSQLTAGGRKQTRRPYIRIALWARTIAAIVVVLVPLPMVLPLLLAALIAFFITMVDRRLNQYVNSRILTNRLWLGKGLNVGLWMYERLGIRIPRKVRRERRHHWQGDLVERVIRQLQVPYSAVVGVICLIASFLLAVL